MCYCCRNLPATARIPKPMDQCVEILAKPLFGTTEWDGFKLRNQPPATLSKSWDEFVILRDNPTLSNLPIHRDTWGSRLDCQINWWMPVYPVSEGNTLELFPDYFAKPVSNTSDSWSVKKFSEWRKRQRSKVDQPGRDSTDENSYPSLPEVPDQIFYVGNLLNCTRLPKKLSLRFCHQHHYQ
eukprot:m.68161 g.68161  ORF g.68161 m.68161 type:complete len:182 (+) comp11945_c0_seq1:510-1055(+)